MDLSKKTSSTQVVRKQTDPFQVNLNRLSRNIVNIGKIKEENIYYKVIFHTSQKYLIETIGLFVKDKKSNLQQQSPRVNSFMFSNKNVSDLCQKFHQVISLYCFIISFYIKRGDYHNARNIYDSLYFEYKDIFNIFYNRIMKNYPNRGGTNTIKAFYPQMIIQTLKALSCLIQLAGRLNKQMYHAFFFNLYFKYLIVIKHKVDTFLFPRSESNQRENAFFIHSLSLSAYYFIWKITPLHTAISLLNRISDIYNESHESDKTEKELHDQYIVYHNLSLLYVSNDQSDNAISSLNRAAIICSLLNECNAGSEPKLRPINQMLVNVYLLLIEVLIDKKEYYSALQYVRKTIPLIEKYGCTTEEQKRMLDIFLKQINSSMHIITKQGKSDKIKEYKMMLIDQGEDSKSTLNFKFEVEEIEKLCLFLSSLSMHQIKLLNDTQPKMKQSVSLPICFSNQFTDCLSFSQRMNLLGIKVLLLSRFVILKDPDGPIALQNLNYDLFALREKPSIVIKTKKPIQVKAKRSVTTSESNQEFDKFLSLFADKNFIKQNKEFLFYLYKTMNSNFLKESIKNPEKMKELILLCKSEFKDQLDSERGFSTSRTRESNEYLSNALSLTERKKKSKKADDDEEHAEDDDNFISNDNEDISLDKNR